MSRRPNFLRRMLAAVRRIPDRRYRHKPESIIPDGQFRLIRLTDRPWWPDYIGNRGWCDGRLRRCPCGDHCCSCQHTERPPDDR